MGHSTFIFRDGVAEFSASGFWSEAFRLEFSALVGLRVRKGRWG